MSTETLLEGARDRSRAEAFYWAGVLILAGLLFGADNLDLLPQIGKADVWSWIFGGAGLYGMLMNLYYAFTPETPSPRTWDYLWSGFWLVLGLSGFFATVIFWPVALLLVGGAILVRTVIRMG